MAFHFSDDMIKAMNQMTDRAQLFNEQMNNIGVPDDLLVEKHRQEQVQGGKKSAFLELYRQMRPEYMKAEELKLECRGHEPSFPALTPGELFQLMLFSETVDDSCPITGCAYNGGGSASKLEEHLRCAHVGVWYKNTGVRKCSYEGAFRALQFIIEYLGQSGFLAVDDDNTKNTIVRLFCCAFGFFTNQLTKRTGF